MNHMISTKTLNETLIPISRFNKGEANKIFEEVDDSGYGIVVKNSKPACVLLSTQRYDSLLETVSDCLLFMEAQRRIQNNNPAEDSSMEDVMREFGIEEGDLDSIDVDID